MAAHPRAAKPGAGKRGVRLNRRQTESCMAAVNSSKILKRLENHVNGTVELTPTQISAARIILDRAIPTLQSVTHTGPDGGDLTVALKIAPHD